MSTSTTLSKTQREALEQLANAERASYVYGTGREAAHALVTWTDHDERVGKFTNSCRIPGRTVQALEDRGMVTIVRDMVKWHGGLMVDRLAMGGTSTELLVTDAGRELLAQERGEEQVIELDVPEPMPADEELPRVRRDKVKPDMVIRSSHGYDLLVTEVIDTAKVRTDDRHVEIRGHLHGNRRCAIRNERYPAGSTVPVVRSDWATVQQELRDGRYGDWHTVVRAAVQEEFIARVGEDSGEGLGSSDVNHIAFGLVRSGELTPVQA